MPDDIVSQLLTKLEQRDARIAELVNLLAERDKENELLRQKVDLLVRKVFGAKSEKLDPTQLLLLLQGLEGPAPGKAPELVAAEVPQRSAVPSPPPTKRAPRIPEHLQVIEEVIEPALVLAHPELWQRIGEEVSERLDYEPARFLCRRTVRPKYVRRGVLDAAPLIAPLPACLQERSLVSPGLLAQIVVSKYCDHLPLYRQESIYWTRHGVWLPRQTMATWVGLAADWLAPIYREIRQGVFRGGYVQIDETPIRYLAPGHGKTKLGYLWAGHAPGGDVVFHWETSRAASCLEKLVPVDYRGQIQCDGYQAYDCFARQRGEHIVLVGCLAHVRRAFYEARDQAPKVAGWFLRQFQLLYEVERELRESRAGPKLRQAKRASASRWVMARLHRALIRLKTKHRFLPSSLMGQAIDYALGQWSSLLLFLENGRLEIDNNLVENAIRPTAVGKKNWLFIGEAEAGERSAIIYTVIESCRKRGLDPFAYLRDVFTQLPLATNWTVKNLTPEAWAAAQRSTNLRAAA